MSGPPEEDPAHPYAGRHSFPTWDSGSIPCPPGLNRAPAPEDELALWERQLWDKGWLLLKAALPPQALDHYLTRLKALSSLAGDGPVHHPVYYGPDFSALMVHEPVYSLMKRILGADMHLWLSEGHVMDRNYHISGWHVDELHLFRPDNISDAVDYPPVLNTLNCHYYLVDVPPELGPTEVVPYSHLSHRYPRKEDGLPPLWRGQGPISFTVKAGDCVIYSSNAWHRGAPITCDRKRYSAVIYYGRRFMAQRHRESHGFRAPGGMLERLSPSELEMLGEHKHPPWHLQYHYQDPGARDPQHPSWMFPGTGTAPPDPAKDS